jgi:hypothetical protein
MSGNNGKGGISVRVHVSSGWISIDWRFRFTGRNHEMVDFISCRLDGAAVFENRCVL